MPCHAGAVLGSGQGSCRDDQVHGHLHPNNQPDKNDMDLQRLIEELPTSKRAWETLSFHYITNYLYKSGAFHRNYK
jgi:hypothetical protein